MKPLVFFLLSVINKYKCVYILHIANHLQISKIFDNYRKSPLYYLSLTLNRFLLLNLLLRILFLKFKSQINQIYSLYFQKAYSFYKHLTGLLIYKIISIILL